MSEAPRNERRGPAAPDFLGRLVDRAFERGNSLEPRRRSLFEPPAATAAGAAVDAPAEDLEGEGNEYATRPRVDGGREREIDRLTMTGEAPALRERPRTDPDSRDESIRQLAPASARRVDVNDEPHVLAALIAPSSTRPHEAVAGRGDPMPRPRKTPVDVAGDTPAGTPHEPTRPALDLPGGALLAQSLVSLAEITRQPGDVRAPESGETLSRSTKASESLRDVVTPPTPRAHRVVVDAATTRHRAPREPLHPEAATHSAEPVVNVTIGRIEVRAVPAQPGPTRLRPQGPKPMSLDDYLKQRGGGR